MVRTARVIQEQPATKALITSIILTLASLGGISSIKWSCRKLWIKARIINLKQKMKTLRKVMREGQIVSQVLTIWNKMNSTPC